MLCGINHYLFHKGQLFQRGCRTENNQFLLMVSDNFTLRGSQGETRRVGQPVCVTSLRARTMVAASNHRGHCIMDYAATLPGDAPEPGGLALFGPEPYMEEGCGRMVAGMSPSGSLNTRLFQLILLCHSLAPSQPSGQGESASARTRPRREVIM